MRTLLDAGLSARDVIDANQVVAYVNRVAEELGVELEEHWDALVDGHDRN